eukprot:gene5691-7857_t
MEENSITPDNSVQFWNKFNEEVNLLKQNIVLANDGPISSTFVILREKLNELQKLATSCTSILPPYDIRRTQEIIETLSKEVKQMETKLIPKKKFAFSSKKTQPSSDSKPEQLPQDEKLIASISSDLKDPTPQANSGDLISAIDEFKVPGSFSILNKTNENLVMKSIDFKESMDNSISIQLLIRDCLESTMQIESSIGSVRVETTTNCSIFLGPCLTSVYLEGVVDSTIFIACHQLRIHKCKNCKLYVQVNSHPIIEDCQEMGFAPYKSNNYFQYEGLEDDFQKSDLLSATCWDNVVDFRWHKTTKSPNWFTLLCIVMIGNILITTSHPNPQRVGKNRINEEHNLNNNSIIFNDSLIINNSTLNDIKKLYSNVTSSKSMKSAPTRKKFHTLFKKFTFKKGITLSFAKSMVKFNTFGFGIKLPITSHFPSYEKMIYYPKISTFIGLFYPLCFRISLSISLPYQVIIYSILYIIKSKDDADKYYKNNKNRIAKYPNEAVQRFGLSISYRIDQSWDHWSAIGLYVVYLPSLAFVQRVLPYLLYLPIFLITMIDFMVAFSTLIFQSIQNYENIIINNNDNHISIKSATHANTNDSMELLSSNSLDAKMNVSYFTNSSYKIVHKLKNSNRTIHHNFTNDNSSINYNKINETNTNNSNNNPLKLLKSAKKKIRYNRIRKSISSWANSRTAAIVGSLGWYTSSHDSSMGSSVNLDFSPFYPLYQTYKQLESYFSAIIYNAHSHNSTVPMPMQALQSL